MDARPSTGVATEAGRGVLWIATAKGWFMLSGAIMLLLLPRLLGIGEYGSFGVVMGIVSVLNMVVIAGTLQAASKFVSEAPDRTGGVLHTLLRLQLAVGGGLFLLAAAGAGTIAGWLGDPDLARLVRLGAVVTLAYAFYAAVIGCLNGLRRFRQQALMDILFASLKTALILLAAAAGLGVAGAMAAFALTAVMLLLLSRAVLGRLPAAEPVAAPAVLRFEAWLMASALLQNLLINTDLFLVKALAPGPAGLPAGIYTGALSVSRLPYQAIIAITFVLFPLISRVTFLDDRASARTYITASLRYALLLMALLSVPLAACSRELLGLLFPADFAAGATAVALLSPAYLLFGLSLVCATIIAGSGRPALAGTLFLAALAVSAGLGRGLVPDHGIDGAAVATLTGMGCAAAVGLALVRRLFGSGLPAPTVVRLLLGATTALLFGRLLPVPDAGWLMAAKLAATTLIFPLVLLLSGEMNADDLARARAVAARGRA